MSSLFRRFLKATTNCGSEILDRSRGSAMEEGAGASGKDPDENLEREPKEPTEVPKPLAAARLLDA
jgi:hypothetical protein